MKTKILRKEDLTAKYVLEGICINTKTHDVCVLEYNVVRCTSLQNDFIGTATVHTVSVETHYIWETTLKVLRINQGLWLRTRKSWTG